MGPRLFGRGNELTEFRLTDDDTLQWGRAFSGAETRWMEYERNAAELLQWGRAFSGAETSPAEDD